MNYIVRMCAGYVSETKAYIFQLVDRIPNTQQSTMYKFIMIFMWWFAISHFSLRLAHMMILYYDVRCMPVWCAWNVNLDYNKCRTSSISRSILFWWDRLQCQRNEITFIRWCICCDSDINSLTAAILVYPSHLVYLTNSFCITSFNLLDTFCFSAWVSSLFRQSFCRLEASSLGLKVTMQNLRPHFDKKKHNLVSSLLRMLFFINLFWWILIGANLWLNCYSQ